MTKMLFAALLTVAIVSSTLLAVPVRADDAAREAVRQSFLAMRSVHSYKFTSSIHSPGFEDMDVTNVTEQTESPRLIHKFLTFGPDKSESVVTSDCVYIRHGRGPWKKDAPQGPPFGPWGHGLLRIYKPAAVYRFVRHDVLGGVPVNVYVYTYRETWGGPTRVDNVIWIGARDHLPRKIVSRDTDARGILQTIAAETFSDFNTPIKITVPDAPNSGPSQAQTHSNGDN